MDRNSSKEPANPPAPGLSAEAMKIIRAIPDDCLAPPHRRMPVAARELVSMEREHAALALRRCGTPVEQIAKVLAIAGRAVYALLERAVKRRLRMDHAAAELARQEILDRQDGMLQVLWVQIEDPNVSVEHKHAAMDRVMKLDDRRMILFGVEHLEPVPPPAPEIPTHEGASASDLTDEELKGVVAILDQARRRKELAQAPRLPAPPPEQPEATTESA